MPSIMPSRKVSTKGRGGKGTKWVWKGFTNSARQEAADKKLVLYHWQKKSAEFPDYPFARFNKKITTVSFTDDEYDQYLVHLHPEFNWNRADTDHLMELVARFDLRWVVIADRFQGKKERSMEQLKQRYYDIALLLGRIRNRNSQLVAAIANKSHSPSAVAAAPGAVSGEVKTTSAIGDTDSILQEKTAAPTPVQAAGPTPVKDNETLAETGQAVPQTQGNVKKNFRSASTPIPSTTRASASAEKLKVAVETAAPR